MLDPTPPVTDLVGDDDLVLLVLLLKVERAVAQLRSGDERVWKARARKMVERVNGLVAAGGPEALAAHPKVAAWVEGGALLELVRLVARGRLDAVDCESAGGGLSPAALARACAAMAGLFAFQRQILAALAYEVIEGLGRRPDCSPTLLRVAAELLVIKGFALAANQLGLQDALTAYLAAHLRPDDRLLHEFAAGLGLGADAGALPAGEAAAAVILPSGPGSPPLVVGAAAAADEAAPVMPSFPGATPRVPGGCVAAGAARPHHPPLPPWPLPGPGNTGSASVVFCRRGGWEQEGWWLPSGYLLTLKNSERSARGAYSSCFGN